jgi:hypothetical protein
MGIKIKKVNKRSNFLQVTVELDGEDYEGILITKGGCMEENEERTSHMDNC